MHVHSFCFYCSYIHILCKLSLYMHVIYFLQEKIYTKQLKIFQGKDAYCDIKDGFVYQQLVSNGFLSKSNNISFQLNTDGVPVFKSSGCSFWPIHLLINELPPSIR